MLEPAAPGSIVARAYLRIGGISVARQQLALALRLKCERVVCIASALDATLVELQHIAEAAGAQFHVISGARPLVGLVTAVDEVIALADGLFASITQAAALLEAGQAVLVQPIEQGLAAGFERIDLNHAAAGAIRIPGRLAERLADLPSDCDAFSSLQRIALQAGIRQHEISGLGQGGLFWSLVRSDEEAHALEPQWIRQRTRDDLPLNFSRGLALLGVRRLGPTMLHAGTGSLALVAAAAVTVLIALGAGWFGWVVPGLGLCALAWVLRESAVLLGRIEGEMTTPRLGIGSAEAFGWVVDAAIAVLAAWGTAPPQSGALPDRLFAPLTLLILLRILARFLPGRWTALLSDRSLVALALGGAVLGGIGALAIRLGAIGAGLAAILLPRGKMS